MEVYYDVSFFRGKRSWHIDFWYKKIDGIEQIRIYAESPDRTTGRFKKFEMYLPKENVTLLEGYTKEELLNITTIISQCKSIIWDLARYYSAGGR